MGLAPPGETETRPDGKTYNGLVITHVDKSQYPARIQIRNPFTKTVARLTLSFQTIQHCLINALT